MASAGPAAEVAEGRYTREFSHTEIKEELENIFGGKKFNVEDANSAASVIQRAAKKWLWRLRVRKVAKEYRESDEGKRQRKRGMIAAEILSTEDSYVRSLQQLVECFYRPMCSLAEHESHNRFRSPAATMEDVQVIFSNIVIIFEFQTTFLAQLREEYNHWPEKPQCIGAVFVRMGAFLKLYTEFSNNFQASLDRIDACMRRKGFKQWLEEAEAKCKLPMNSLLIMPIQRTPRYRLLLQELLKYTTDDHVDFDNLTKGLEKIKDVASYINETKRSAERGEIVLQKQMMIRGLDLNLVHPNRYFVNMGHLVRMTKDGAPENRTFFLFNDMLLATKPDPHSKLFNYDGYVLIRGAVVHTFPDKKKTIVIEFPRINRKITYKADSQETKDKWVTWLKEALTDIDGQPSDSASDLLLEPEHFSGGTTKKAGYLHYSENGLAATKTKRYWFCLEQGVLLCYSPKKRNLKRSFQLENFKIRAVEGAHLPLIELYTPDVSSHIIVAANAKQQQQWIKVLTSSKIYEDLPITGLALIHLDQGELAPLGFTPVMRTWYGNSANLNAEAGGRDIRLCYERNGKDAEGNPKPPITSLSLIFVDGDGLFRRRWSAEVLPANKGWHQVSKTAYGKADGNVNHGSGGREAYLLYKTEPHKPAITSVSLYYEQVRRIFSHALTKFADQFQEGVVTPDGFTPVFYTVSGKYRADLNKGTKKGVPIVLCFKTEDDEELFVQSKLGYVPGKGIDEGRMNPSWKKLLEDAKVPLSDLKTMDDAKFVVQEAAACMDQLSAEKVLKAETAKLSCYKCKSVFLFHKSSKYVKCPSCGSTNLAPGSTTSVKSDSSKLRKMAEQQPQPEVTLLHSTQQSALQQQPMRQQQQQPQQQPLQQQPLQQPVQMQQMQQAPQQTAQLQQQASVYYSSQPPPQQHSVPQFGAQQIGGNAGQYGSQCQPPQSVHQAAYCSSAYGSQAPLVPSLPGHLPSQQPPPSYGSSLQPQVPFAPYSPSYGGSSPYNSAASYNSGAPSPGPSSPYSSAVRPLQQIPQYAPPFQSQYGHQVAPSQGYGGPSAYQSAATSVANPPQAYQQPYQSGFQQPQQPQQPAYQQPQQQAQQPQQYYQQPYQSVQMRQPAPQQAQQAPPQQLQQPSPMVRVSSTAAGIDDMSEIPTGEVIADAPSEANGKLMWEDLSAEDYERVAKMLQQRMEQKRSGLEDFALI